MRISQGSLAVDAECEGRAEAAAAEAASLPPPGMPPTPAASCADRPPALPGRRPRQQRTARNRNRRRNRSREPAGAAAAAARPRRPPPPASRPWPAPGLAPARWRAWPSGARRRGRRRPRGGRRRSAWRRALRPRRPLAGWPPLAASLLNACKGKEQTRSHIQSFGHKQRKAMMSRSSYCMKMSTSLTKRQWQCDKRIELRDYWFAICIESPTLQLSMYSEVTPSNTTDATAADVSLQSTNVCSMFQSIHPQSQDSGQFK